MEAFGSDNAISSPPRLLIISDIHVFTGCLLSSQLLLQNQEAWPPLPHHLLHPSLPPPRRHSQHPPDIGDFTTRHEIGGK